jgi:uncharacterized protein YdaU (DUF1376 family)
MKWYKHDPDAWLAAVIALTPEERGIYQTIINLLYSRNGDLPTNDDNYFARYCACRPQTWRRIRDALITKGKLHYKTDGKLTANRVETAIKEAFERSVSNEECSNINAKTPVRARVQPQPDIEKPKKASLSASALPTKWQLDEQDADYARSKGWPSDRITAEAERFRDHAQSKGRMAKNWHAAWRNWVTSPFQHANGSSRAAVSPRPGSREDQQEKTANAYAKFCEHFAPGADEPRTGGDDGAQTARLLPFGKTA